MDNNIKEIEKKQKEWEDTTLKESLKQFPEREIYSELPRKCLYTPKDLADNDYLENIGFPGEFPYTRGNDATMNRNREWQIAQNAGFGLPEDTNKRWKMLFKTGQRMGDLALPPDMPTQMGIDSDNPLAEGEVGVIGVAVPSVKEVEALFEGIPLDKTEMRTPLNHMAIVFWMMVVAVAEKQGIPCNNVGGNCNTDFLMEYLGRNNTVFSIQGAERVSLDFMEWGIKNMPKLWFQSNTYSTGEAGCTSAQEGGFFLAQAFHLIDRLLERGLDIDSIAPRIVTNTATYMDFFGSIAKFRALRRLWAKMIKERYGAKNPASLRLNTDRGPTGSSDLTAQQPMNNIIRVAIMALASMLSGTKSLFTNSYDDAHAIPTEKAVTLSVRTQQILAYETGILDVVDPLGGSYYVEALTDEMEKEMLIFLNKIEAQGGLKKAVESGWAQGEVTLSAYGKQKDIEEGKRIIVGVNKFVTPDEQIDFELHRADPMVGEEMKRRLKKLREERDNSKVQRCLAEIRKVARGNDNLTPFVLDAVRNYATLGEVCDVFRDVFGTYKTPAIA